MKVKDIEKVLKEMFPKDHFGPEDHGNGTFSISIPKGRSNGGITIWTNKAGIDEFNKALKKDFERHKEL